MAVTWNPWHGCTKISEGCARCYVYRIDIRHGRDPTRVERTAFFSLPAKRQRTGAWKIEPGETVFTCLSSDFFIAEADGWRDEVWRLIRSRPDLSFYIITKRVDRIQGALPADWGSGYSHVTIAATVENQVRADERLPLFARLPLPRKAIMCEPLLGPLDIAKYLETFPCAEVIVGGESGPGARQCNYDWVLALRDQCDVADVVFRFKQTGACLLKDGRLYRIPRALQIEQARKADIDIPVSRSRTGSGVD